MINESHRLKQNITAPNGVSCRFYVRYRPDRKEFYRALRLCDRQRFGPVRMALQCGITAVIGLGCLIHYLVSSTKPENELMVAVLCFVFSAVAGLFDPLSAWYAAGRQFAQGRKIHLWLGEDFIGFGKTAEIFTRWEYTDFTLLQTDGLWVLRHGKSTVIVLPTAALSDEAIAFFTERMNHDDQ